MKTQMPPNPSPTQIPEQHIADLKPDTAAPFLHRILVPTDLTEHSNLALKYAISLAERYGAKIFLLNVAQIPASSSIIAPPDMEEMISAAHLLLDNIARAIPPNLDREEIVLVGTGETARQIVEEALNISADLIVMTTHGYSGVKRMLRGSMAEMVVRHAHCAVLVARSEVT